MNSDWELKGYLSLQNVCPWLLFFLSPGIWILEDCSVDLQIQRRLPGRPGLQDVYASAPAIHSPCKQHGLD